MKSLSLPALGGLLVLALLGACKKAETPAPSASEQPQTPAGGSSAAASSASPSTPSTAPAGNGVLLKVKWPVGNRYVYRMDLDQNSTNNIPQMPRPMQQNVSMAMTYGLSVVKETTEGGRELEMEFLANEMEVKMGDQVMVSFDSKESAKTEAQNPFVDPFRKMIGSKIRLQMDADGKVDKVLGLEEWLDQLAGEGPGPARTMLSQQFNEGYFRQIADFGRGLPDKPVEVGDSWPFSMELPAGPMGKIKVDSTFMLKGLEEREGRQCAVLDTLGTFKGAGPSEGAGPMGNMTIEQGKLQGTSWFDPELGALVEATTDQSMRLNGEMPGQTGNNGAAPKFTSDISQKIELKLVEMTQAKE